MNRNRRKVMVQAPFGVSLGASLDIDGALIKASPVLSLFLALFESGRPDASNGFAASATPAFALQLCYAAI
jgi:hypothetical protein